MIVPHTTKIDLEPCILADKVVTAYCFSLLGAQPDYPSIHSRLIAYDRTTSAMKSSQSLYRVGTNY